MKSINTIYNSIICLDRLLSKIFAICIAISQSDIVYCIDGFLAALNGESYVLNAQFKFGTILSQKGESYFYY